MPALLRWRNCRFYFYSHEGNEPPHVHVDCAEKTAKFWLEPVKLVYSEGFNSRDLGDLAEQVHANADRFLEAWHAHFR